MRRSALATSLVTGALTSLALLTHPAGAAPAVTKAATGALHTSGNKIVDSNTAQVVLKGLHRDGTQGGPSTSTTPVSAAELRT